MLGADIDSAPRAIQCTYDGNKQRKVVTSILGPDVPFLFRPKMKRELQ